MTTEVKNIIREAIINSHKVYVETNFAYDSERLNSKLNKEFYDYMKPKVDKIIEFVNPKTGRINHKRCGKQFQTYVYTQEMLDKDLDDLRTRINNNHELRFQVNADDSLRCFNFQNVTNPTDKDIQWVYYAYGNLAEHLIGFNVRTYHYFGTNDIALYASTDPIFDEPTQQVFWSARESYMNDKAAWCEKYGSN